MSISHWWPGITPFNVWGLTLGLWLRYAAAADAMMREARDGG